MFVCFSTVDVPDTSVFHPNCTASCDCTSSVFEPVCGADNVVYFSPCQAGCPPNDNVRTTFIAIACVIEHKKKLSVKLTRSVAPVASLLSFGMLPTIVGCMALYILFCDVTHGNKCACIYLL